jgi:uncharacterized membrane protein YphA (DoxX/SURF4 family)
MRALRAWVALWDRREPATAQALVRIFVGMCLVFDLVQMGALGLVDAVWAPPPDGMGYGANAGLWSVRWFGRSAGTAELLYAAALISGVLFMIGLATRVSALVFVLVYAQLGYYNVDADRGIDTVFRTIVLIMAFSHGHARWSVDAWVRRRFLKRPYPDEVPAWPRYLLFLQLLWIYFSGGHNKTGREWGLAGGFTALANVLSDPHFSRFTDGWVTVVHPLTRLATAATMAFELGAPLMIVLTWLHATRARRHRVWRSISQLRWAWIAIGASFHLGIAVFMQLGVFPWGMLALYPVLFHSSELIAAESWLRARLGRGDRHG